MLEWITAGAERGLKGDEEMDKNRVLTDEEIKSLGSMSQYWDEVSKREDKKPLRYELQNVQDMLGTRFLWILEHYLELISPRPPLQDRRNDVQVVQKKT